MKGRYVLSEADGRALLEAADKARDERAHDMPDDGAALRALHRGYTRLKELGWREAIYCPKDGSRFQVIEAGSTGIFTCYYEGEWPKGCWWIEDGNDVYPSRPILWRPMPASESIPS